jgi:hypothetical protein
MLIAGLIHIEGGWSSEKRRSDFWMVAGLKNLWQVKKFSRSQPARLKYFFTFGCLHSTHHKFHTFAASVAICQQHNHLIIKNPFNFKTSTQLNIQPNNKHVR